MIGDWLFNQIWTSAGFNSEDDVTLNERNLFYVKEWEDLTTVFFNTFLDVLISQSKTLRIDLFSILASQWTHKSS